MSCLYDMSELNVPFSETALWGVPLKKVGVKVVEALGRKFEKAAFEKPTKDSVPEAIGFYTLYVCKECRSDWLGTIELWFNTKPRAHQESCGSGIYVRENGATVEITREEWDRRNPGREPVRVVDNPPPEPLL